MNEKKNIGIYVHIPFCRSKCLYCDFYSLPNVDREQMERYVTALCRHIEILGERAIGRTVDTVFFGGGTPTALSSDQLSAIVNAIDRSFGLSSDTEFTVEANPATFDVPKLVALRELGVNRISLGMQSACDNELKLLGRAHTLEQIKIAVDHISKADIRNFNLDIMYGIPSQTESSFLKTLDTVKELSPDHVSVYGLQLEEGTPLYRRQDKYVFPDEDTEKTLNRMALTELTAAGYSRYEISNYAKKGCECRHNLKYWLGDDYIGIGAAAHSYFLGERYRSPENVCSYIEAITNGTTESIELDRATVSHKERIAEYVMLRMRLTEGISPEEFQTELGIDFSEHKKRLNKFISTGHVRVTNNRYSFTPEGFDLSNYILSELI